MLLLTILSVLPDRGYWWASASDQDAGRGEEFSGVDRNPPRERFKKKIHLEERFRNPRVFSENAGFVSTQGGTSQVLARFQWIPCWCKRPLCVGCSVTHRRSSPSFPPPIDAPPTPSLNLFPHRSPLCCLPLFWHNYLCFRIDAALHPLKYHYITSYLQHHYRQCSTFACRGVIISVSLCFPSYAARVSARFFFFLTHPPAPIFIRHRTNTTTSLCLSVCPSLTPLLSVLSNSYGVGGGCSYKQEFRQFSRRQLERKTPVATRRCAKT